MIDVLDQQGRTDRLVQSIDIAIKHLVDAEDDPLALAFYLWTIRQHNLSLVNGEILARWGEAWVCRIFIDGILSRRRDEEITSAALAAAALSRTNALKDSAEQIRATVRLHIAGELDRYSIPFKQPRYGAILLFAARQLEADDPRSADANQAVITTYSSILPRGRMFGLGMALEVFRQGGREDAFANIRSQVLDALHDPGIDYEDELYLFSALWHSYDGTFVPPVIFANAEKLVEKSPIWPYLMSGGETLPPAEEPMGEITISHLYRATLLDLLFLLRRVSHSQRDAQLDEKYRGRKVVGFLAFGSPLIVLAGLWAGLIDILIRNASAAKQYWLLGNYAAPLHFSAFLFLCALFLSFYLGRFTFLIIKSLWDLLIVKTVESDWRLGQILRHDAGKALRMWWVGLIVVLILGVGGNFLAPGVQHLIIGK